MDKADRAIRIICTSLTLIALAINAAIIIKSTRQPVKEESDKVVQNTVITSEDKSLPDVQNTFTDRKIYFLFLPLGQSLRGKVYN